MKTNFLSLLVIAISLLSFALWLTNPIMGVPMESSLSTSTQPLPLDNKPDKPWTYNPSEVVPYSWLTRVPEEDISAMRKDLSSLADPDLVNTRDAYGLTGLMIAAQLLDLPRAELLISRGANVNLKSLDNINDTALHMVVRKLDLPDTFLDKGIQFIKLLLAHGAGLGEKNSDGRTPLHYISGIINPTLRSEVLEILMRAGANINAQDNMGETPLYIAINFLHLNAEDFIEEVMNKYGKLVDPNIRNLRGETLIDYARNNKFMRVVQVLCKTRKWECSREDEFGIIPEG